MRLVKLALFGVLVVALGAVWFNRVWVADAYRSDRAAEPLRLSGVDLAYRVSEIEPSPYTIPQAPDGRTGPAPVFDGGVVTPPAAPSLQGGSARLEGTVVGPDGPVQAAVVRIERHTSHGAVGLDVTTDDEGRWQLGPVAGGRYRVRAWLPGLLTNTRSEVRFVADDELASFDVSLAPVDPTPAFEFVHAGPLYEGAPGTVAVVLSWRSVDQDGLVVTNPVPGAEVTVSTTAQVQVVSPMPVLTDGTGAARIQVRCVPTGSGGGGPAGPPAGPPNVPQPADVGLTSGQLVRSATPILPVQSSVPSGGPAGSLTATSGQISGVFALPGCQPVPVASPAPVPPSTPGSAPETEVPTDG